jgi:repressor LexA
MTLTPKQQEMLSFIARYQQEKGYAPTQAEIAKEFGFSSLGTVQNYLVRLQRQGLLKKDWNGKRALALTRRGQVRRGRGARGELDLGAGGQLEPPASPLHLEFEAEFGGTMSRPQPQGSPAPLQIKLLGSVAAGRPIEAIEDDQAVLNLTTTVFRNIHQNHFALKVKGDSMVEDGIFDGDFVVIKSQHTAINGEVVVAVVDGNATIKRFYKYPDRIELHPANANYAPMVYEGLAARQVAIKGILTTVIRAVR